VISRLLGSPVVFHTVNRLLTSLNDVNFRCLSRVLRPAAEDWILDVGCGTGRYAGRWTCRYVGVDADERYLAFARRQYGGRFFRGDAARLAIRDGRFDAAFCVGVLHHLDDSAVRRTVGEMMRVCQPGGTLMMVEPLAPESGDGWLRRGLARLERGEYFRPFDELTRLLSGCVGPGLRVAREHTHPFDLGLYSAQIPEMASRM
jgi:ubiquinone/menaquinone biosynthesis C-methylase UbiE